MEENELHKNDVYLAQWLDGTISDKELQELVSEVDYVAYVKLKKGIDVYEQLEAPIKPSFEKINYILNAKKQRSHRLANWSIGAAAILILCFGLLTIFGNDTLEIQSNFGEQKTIALLDGSEVILNSKSLLSYDTEDWEYNRTLFLEGEAYFKVKKGSTFTVNTNNGSVAVLGTQFNVNSKSDYFEVVCYEGKVGVTNSDGLNVLTPNQNIRKINGNALEKWKVELEQPSWIHGESTFNSIPIKYVITAIEEQYNVDIDKRQIDDTVIFTGSFSHGNLSTALKTVFKTLEITYIEKEKNSIVLSLD
ncbi:hypothetical protein A9Q87_07640 [Flavobacteriales bacterium 34_180_T64]|nr:hypothetical protein A9Q87_07640 [Flavobacteriales bacterium 34_180_T64]